MELTATISMAVAPVVSFVVVWLLRRRQKPLNLPPGPRGWPVFGSINLLAGPLPPHRALAALAAGHGLLMHLRLGSFHAVVASSAETARLVLKTDDLAFADRPPSAMGATMSYGYKGIVQTPYGAYWRMARKLCATELFSVRRVESFERARGGDARVGRGLFESGSAGAGAGVEAKERLLNLTMRNILRMAVGEKWSGCHGSEEGLAFRRALDEAFAVTGAVDNVGEWRVHELFDRFVEQILDEHEGDRRRRSASVGGGEFPARDLVDVLLQLSEEGGGEAEESEPEARLTRDGVKAFVQDIIVAGTYTAAVTMEWAMAELLRRPDAMAHAAAELDRRDLPALPYLDAVLKETMRLHPVAPFLLPHRAREDAVVGGYDVPAGARVLVNAWAVARDPASWPGESNAFRPERFLAGGGAAEGVDEMAATLANLVHGFTWRLPDGVAPKDVSMEECFGLTASRKVPLVAVAEAAGAPISPCSDKNIKI
uniref:Cytochrome P450 n=1 Tax=Setaria italica TaxID=4555 RepID=K3ZFK8_SETIT